MNLEHSTRAGRFRSVSRRGSCERSLLRLQEQTREGCRVVSSEALERVRLLLPEVDSTRISPTLNESELPALFTVTTVVRLIALQLSNEKQPDAVCDQICCEKHQVDRATSRFRLSEMDDDGPRRRGARRPSVGPGGPPLTAIRPNQLSVADFTGAQRTTRYAGHRAHDKSVGKTCSGFNGGFALAS